MFFLAPLAPMAALATQAVVTTTATEMFIAGATAASIIRSRLKNKQ